MKNPFKSLLQWVQNLTIFFLLKISQQIWLLEPSKVLADMGCGWQVDWATAKMFLSNLHSLVMNKCWKFQKDILIYVKMFDMKPRKLICIVICLQGIASIVCLIWILPPAPFFINGSKRQIIWGNRINTWTKISL